MKILVVQESDWLERGPHQSHHLMERLVKLGHQVLVIDHDIDWRKKEGNFLPKRRVVEHHSKVIKGGELTVIRPPTIRLPVLEYGSLLITHRNEIHRQIREFNPDIIIGFGILNCRIAIRMAEKEGIPFLYYIIDELHRLVPQQRFQWLARHVESGNLRRADEVISINEQLRHYTIAMGAPPARTEVISAGVDLKRFQFANGQSLRQDYGFDEDDCVLFFMGWLYSFSGLLEVAKSLATTNEDNIKMLILGKGELWGQLDALRTEKGMKNRIVLESWKPHEQIPTYIAASNICLLPAQKKEIMMNIVPIKIYEYLAGGKPVITTALPGVMREFGDDNGVIFVDNPSEVLAKVKEILVSDNLLEIGKKGKKFVENKDWDIITDRFEKELCQLVSGSKPMGVIGSSQPST